MAVDTVNAADLTQEQVKALLITPLESQSVILSSGVQIIDGNGSPVRLPKMGPATSPGWFGENELIGEEDPTFSEVLLLPESMKSLKTITRYSNEMARQSIIALDQAIKRRLVKDVGDAMDQAFIDGDGDIVGGKQTTPIGILNMAETSGVDAVGAITIDDLHDAEGVALAADVNPESLKWLMRSEVFVALRKQKATGTGGYLIQPDPTEAGAYRLLGHPVKVTNRLPKDAEDESAVVLWDPSQVAVARDVMPSIKVLDQTFAQYDQQALRVVSRADIGALNAEAVVILRGVTAA
jgi:HK97 family phage major capsid protein